MKLGNEEWITVAEAASQTGYSERYIQHLLRTGRIKGLKVRRDWLTTLQAVNDFKQNAKRGRPPTKKK
jgi:excisionase family DNA binding protein